MQMACVAQTLKVLEYDADGNVVSDGRWKYSWDGENRLVKVESRTDTPQASWRRVQWVYDPKRRTIPQTTWMYTHSTWVVTEDLKLVYDNWRCIEEMNATNNSVVRGYVWGLNLSGTLDGAGDVGGLLWMTVHNGPGTGTHFTCYDGNGNVVALVNASDGAISANYEYGPFGEVIRSTGLMGKGNLFRFSTKRTFNSSDLVLYEYCAYSPGLGRWLSRDPISELSSTVFFIDAKDVKTIKRLLPASPEAVHIGYENCLYSKKLSSLDFSLAFKSKTNGVDIVPVYVFARNTTTAYADPDGNVAQWVAACGVGCVFGSIGGVVGGIGSWRAAWCGALGGAINGCCSSVLCTSLPNLCIKGSCIFGVIGAIAEQLCLGRVNYKDPCAWVGLLFSGFAGCLGGWADDIEDATTRLVAFVVGMDISAWTSLCGKWE
jgi:RHS repeat-associated protein